MSEKFLFAIPNNHPGSELDTIDWANASFRSYFENEHGEQWVCWLDDNGVHVASGAKKWRIVKVESTANVSSIEADLPLNDCERIWLDACFTAMHAYTAKVAREAPKK